MIVFKWRYAYSVLLALIIGRFVASLGEKYVMLLVGLTLMWLVVTMLVMVIAYAFYYAKEYRPAKILFLFVVALAAAFWSQGQ